MSQDQWTAVDNYFDGLFAPSDDVLSAALQATTDAGLPAISVSPSQGKLLHLLAKMHNVRSILEIGTLGGYSTIWLARALPADGRLISLELDPAHAAVARANIARAGLAAHVEVRVGKAIESLPQLDESGAGPFDLVFIDADKVSTPDYLTWAFRLTKPGSLIIIDNVVRSGAVAEPTTTDPNVQGVQKALAMLAADKRVISAATQTVGSKGYDGFAIAFVVGA
ncbi:MAG: O-methyltransferase [Anaerolineae bacterium]|nr:O-methyltransferase [Anaerolineae bacterium]